MGKIISYSEFKSNVDIDVSALIVYCCKCEMLNDVPISINKMLAEKLVCCKVNRRTMRIDRFFNEILETLPVGSIIKEFEVMFNPQYKVDVLRIMELACKRRNYSIVWPGILKGNNLVYADYGYQDYKSYNITDYNVICVI